MAARRPGRDRVPGPTVPVYVISVAAGLTGLYPQTLRQYDRAGLVSPGRTGGGGRRYSLRDVAQLREVLRLSGEGVSLEGIKRVLDLENEVVALRDRVRRLEQAGAPASQQQSTTVGSSPPAPDTLSASAAGSPTSGASASATASTRRDA